MTWATFLDLVEQLCSHLEWQNTTMEHPLSADTWLAITLLKLIMSSSLHDIGHHFGAGKATTGEAILEGVSARLNLSQSHCIPPGDWKTESFTFFHRIMDQCFTIVIFIEDVSLEVKMLLVSAGGRETAP
ncbi:hypothetical protein Y1Q_0021120 [Alligator mississippiensis]|uniref:Uncharacterized protein n=1 Tax=Alligator mississippiensis TaxID=8496 RepID=A0A151NRX0_ALLMI|nr:hypothetical protein Y1Q_0021120 [Alligator mississippiensis]